MFISPRPSRCVEDRTAPSQQQLIHIKAVVLKESETEGKEGGSKETCLNGREVVELSLDTNVLIRYHGGLVLTGQPVMVSVTLRANLSAKVVIIRYTKGVERVLSPTGFQNCDLETLLLSCEFLRTLVFNCVSSG